SPTAVPGWNSQEVSFGWTDDTTSGQPVVLTISFSNAGVTVGAVATARFNVLLPTLAPDTSTPYASVKVIRTSSVNVGTKSFIPGSPWALYFNEVLPGIEFYHTDVSTDSATTGTLWWVQVVNSLRQTRRKVTT